MKSLNNLIIYDLHTVQYYNDRHYNIIIMMYIRTEVTRYANDEY